MSLSSSSSSSSLEAIAERLAQYTINPNSIQRSQLVHRLHLLDTWFPQQGSTLLDQSEDTQSPGCILEIGCGQGDMTLALAHYFSVRGWKQHEQIHAVDPAPLTYGSPYTLGQSQAIISRSVLGSWIKWVQQDPITYLSSPSLRYQYIVLAHSIFYLPDRKCLSDILTKCYETAVNSGQQGNATPTRLLLAEWGMRASCPEAEAHVLAVRAQMASPIDEGNVRCAMTPQFILELALNAGWKLERERWISSPNLDDGKWEVDAAKQLLQQKDLDENVKTLLKDMTERAALHDVKSMDVWTAVFVV